MKKLVSLFVLLFSVSMAWSQDEVVLRDQKAQEKIKAARIAFITERLELTPAEAEKFWPIYREFYNKRIELRQQFEDVRKNPNQNIPVEDHQAKLVELSLKIKQQELDLERDYSHRILNVIPAQKLMALKKAEDDFRRLLLKQIQQRQMEQQQKQQFKDRNEQRLKQRNN